MINDECKKEIEAFLIKHPNPSLVTSQPMIDGYVTCIGPVGGICGPELHCNAKTKPFLVELVR